MTAPVDDARKAPSVEAEALVAGLRQYPTLSEDDPNAAKREAFIQGYIAARALPQQQSGEEK